MVLTRGKRHETMALNLELGRVRNLRFLKIPKSCLPPTSYIPFINGKRQPFLSGTATMIELDRVSVEGTKTVFWQQG